MTVSEPSATYLGEVHQVDDLAQILADRARIEEMRKRISAGDVYVVKGVLNRSLLERIRDYLTHIGRSSLPNYQAIVKGAPNSHRLNQYDDRAYVRGCFHQFQFFPWNQDVFNLFETFRPVYQLKNLISGLPPDSFLGREPEDGITARLAFQYYPRGIGKLNMHSDPVDRHQLTIPTMLLSKKGEDYDSGGLVVQRKNGQLVEVDPLMEWGDLLLFRADLAHGVQQIDPDAKPDWTSFAGRWMVIVAVNKLQETAEVRDAVDLDQSD